VLIILITILFHPVLSFRLFESDINFLSKLKPGLHLAYTYRRKVEKQLNPVL